MSSRSLEAIYDDESPQRARELLLALAEAGDGEAQFFLGHLADEESPRKPDVALAWYRKASENGYPEAKHWAASFLYHGVGAPQDIQAALVLFRESAESGDPASQWKLGEHLSQFSESRDEGLAWLVRAASQGHSAAKALLEQQVGRGA